MAKKSEIPELKLKIVGRRYRTKSYELEDGTREERDMLEVTMIGIDGNKGTKLVRLVDPDEGDAYPEREIVTITSDLKQQRLALDKPKGKGAAVNAH